jgi:tRNA pseudouridine32 synthase/23S rRNA pseudouridine746 synthase
MSLADRILYIDDDAIIVDKPAGLPVETPKSGGDSLVSRISELRCGKHKDPVPVQRLDRDVSGCLLLARNREERSKIQQALENEAVVKYFLAVVDAEVEESEGKIELPLAKHSSPENGFRMIVADRGEQAVTEWIRLKVRDGRSLIRFEPKTSRTHQIRVHAREAFGAGIVGDPIYGSGAGPMLLHASRLSVALSPMSTGFSYHADAPLPDYFGGWRIDPAEVERDQEALRAAFTYRDVERDTDMGLEDLDRPVFYQDRYGGYGPYWRFRPFVIDSYHVKGALEPLVKMYSDFKYPVGSELDRILADLVAAKRGDLMEKLWASITRRSRAAFYAERPGQFFGDQHWADKAKADALQAYDDAIGWLAKLDSADAVQRMELERDMLREGRRPEPPPVSEHRKMDDALFWEIIGRSRAEALELPDQLVLLEGLLGGLKAADIKKFASIYARYMRQLYHWNAWALAYAARGGCSDDSFMEFRSWLILQGDPALLDLAIKDPAAAAAGVPRDPELPDGTLMPMIDDIHLARAGTTFEWPMTDLETPKGREWPEDELDARFPELVAYYEG